MNWWGYAHDIIPSRYFFFDTVIFQLLTIRLHIYRNTYHFFHITPLSVREANISNLYNVFLNVSLILNLNKSEGLTAGCNTDSYQPRSLILVL